MLHKIAGNPNVEVSLLIVDADRMTELNSRYMGRDEPTDVLAFPMVESPEIKSFLSQNHAHPEPLGDIVICLPVARDQAGERMSSEMEEVELLAAHGLLHLLGYEDDTQEGRQEMRRLEALLLERMSDQNCAGD